MDVVVVEKEDFVLQSDTTNKVSPSVASKTNNITAYFMKKVSPETQTKKQQLSDSNSHEKKDKPQNHVENVPHINCETLENEQLCSSSTNYQGDIQDIGDGQIRTSQRSKDTTTECNHSDNNSHHENHHLDNGQISTSQKCDGNSHHGDNNRDFENDPVGQMSTSQKCESTNSHHENHHIGNGRLGTSHKCDVVTTDQSHHEKNSGGHVSTSTGTSHHGDGDSDYDNNHMPDGQICVKQKLCTKIDVTSDDDSNIPTGDLATISTITGGIQDVAGDGVFATKSKSILKSHKPKWSFSWKSKNKKCIELDDCDEEVDQKSSKSSKRKSSKKKTGTRQGKNDMKDLPENESAQKTNSDNIGCSAVNKQLNLEACNVTPDAITKSDVRVSSKNIDIVHVTSPEKVLGNSKSAFDIMMQKTREKNTWTASDVESDKNTTIPKNELETECAEKLTGKSRRKRKASKVNQDNIEFINVEPDKVNKKRKTSCSSKESEQNGRRRSKQCEDSPEIKDVVIKRKKKVEDVGISKQSDTKGQCVDHENIVDFDDSNVRVLRTRRKQSRLQESPVDEDDVEVDEDDTKEKKRERSKAKKGKQVKANVNESTNKDKSKSENPAKKATGPIAPIFLPGAWRKAKKKLEEDELEASITEVEEQSTLSNNKESVINIDEEGSDNEMAVKPYSPIKNVEERLKAFMGLFKPTTVKSNTTITLPPVEAPWPKMSHVRQLSDLENLPVIRNRQVYEEYFDSLDVRCYHSSYKNRQFTQFITCFSTKFTPDYKENETSPMSDTQTQAIIKYLKTIFTNIPVRKFFKRCRLQLERCKKAELEAINMERVQQDMIFNLTSKGNVKTTNSDLAANSGVKSLAVISVKDAEKKTKPVKPSPLMLAFQKQDKSSTTSKIVEETSKNTKQACEKRRTTLKDYMDSSTTKNMAKEGKEDGTKKSGKSRKSSKKSGKITEILEADEHKMLTKDVATRVEVGSSKMKQKSSKNKGNKCCDETKAKKREREVVEVEKSSSKGPAKKKAKLITDDFKPPKSKKKKPRTSENVTSEHSAAENMKSPKLSSDEDFVKSTKKRSTRMNAKTVEGGVTSRDAENNDTNVRRSGRLKKKVFVEETLDDHITGNGIKHNVMGKFDVNIETKGMKLCEITASANIKPEMELLGNIKQQPEVNRKPETGKSRKKKMSLDTNTEPEVEHKRSVKTEIGPVLRGKPEMTCEPDVRKDEARCPKNTKNSCQTEIGITPQVDCKPDVARDVKVTSNSEENIDVLCISDDGVRPPSDALRSSVTSEPDPKGGQRTVLWTECFKPGRSDEILGNASVGNKLKNWLSEWKSLREKKLDKMRKRREKKKKRLTMDDKVSSSVGSEWWYEDDSDFMDSDDSDNSYYDEDDEDILCNTMILTGKTGCGKTSAVYACAKELGFKVIEVNSSCKRGGKYILTEFQEATQSHQVSRKRHSLEKDGNIEVGNEKTERKGKEKRGKKTKKVKKKNENENQIKKPTTQAKMSLILLDEVDILFEEDKGFWAAVNQLRLNSKRPIVMTASDLTVSMDGRFEHLSFKQPPYQPCAGYLQAVCLSKDIFLDPNDLRTLVATNNGDLRQSLLCLQFWCESYAGTHDSLGTIVHERISKVFNLLASKKDSVVDEKREVDANSERKTSKLLSPASENSVQEKVRFEEKNKTSSVEDENAVTNFCENRTKITDEDIKLTSANVDSNKNLNKIVEKTDVSTESDGCIEESLSFNEECVMHRLYVESFLGLRNITGSYGSVLNILRCKERNINDKLSREDLFNFKCAVTSHCQDLCFDVIRCNLATLLPCLFTYINNIEDNRGDKNQTDDAIFAPGVVTCASDRNRVNCEDLTDQSIYDDDTTKEFTDVCEPHMDKTPVASVVQLGALGPNDESPRKSTCQDDDKRNLFDVTLSSYQQLLENLSYMDAVLRRSEDKKYDQRSYIAIRPGLEDDVNHSPQFPSWKSRRCLNELRGALEVASLERCHSYYHERMAKKGVEFRRNTVRLLTENANLCQQCLSIDDRKDTEQIVGLRTSNQTTCAGTANEETILKISTCHELSDIKSKDNYDSLVRFLPDYLQLNRTSLTLDYIPTLHNICHNELLRHASRTKRRFYHYFDSIGLNLPQSTIELLSQTNLA